MFIKKYQAESLAKKYNINLSVVGITQWWYGLNVELEHGRKNIFTNISNDSLDITAKIAIAHLMEDPEYYYYLKYMEKQRERYWKSKKKPTIFK